MSPPSPSHEPLRKRVHGSNLLAAIAAIVIAVGSGQLLAGAFEAGVTTDEPTHVDRLATWIDTGWYLPERNVIDGEPDPNDELATPYVYGPAFAVAAHAVNVVLDNETVGTVSSSADAYEVRHLMVALLALLTVAVVGGAVWLFTRSWRFGLWAAAGLLAVPVWMGQAFFNVKDVPAAAGYTLVTVGLALALVEGWGRLTPGRRKALVVSLLAAGLLVGVGTRLSVWIPYAASFATYAALRLGQRRLGGISRERGGDLAVVLGGLIGIAAIAVLYPKVASTPADLLVNSVSDSTGYPNTVMTLTAGQLLSENPPAWYLPAWIASTYPLLMGALALLGGVLSLRRLVRRGNSPLLRSIWGRTELGMLLPLQQATLVPLAAIITGAVMYDGIRQHLYVVPAIAIFAGIGAARLWQWAQRRRGERPWLSPGAVALLSLALVVPMFEQTLLFPYNYTYVNPVAGIGGVNGRWETDYWFASAPEALARVPREADLGCVYDLAPANDPAAEVALVPCGGDYFDPFREQQGTSADAGGGNSGLWVIGRRRADRVPPASCREVDNVTRWLRGETVTMSYVMRCPSTRGGS